METIHIQKYIHSTPRKLRLVADMVRKLEPALALNILKFTKKAAAKDLGEAIKVALANAKTGGLSNTYFKHIEINEGPKMRRFHAGTRGRVKPFKRRMAHIKIVLTDNQVQSSPPKADRPLDEKIKSETRKSEDKEVKINKEEGESSGTKDTSDWF